MTQESPTARRSQTGDGAKTPPESSWSTSEGDRNRGSLGPSRFPRRFIRYVGNDDGTPIAEETNRLLGELIVEMRALRAAVDRQG